MLNNETYLWSVSELSPTIIMSLSCVYEDVDLPWETEIHWHIHKRENKEKFCPLILPMRKLWAEREMTWEGSQWIRPRNWSPARLFGPMPLCSGGVYTPSKQLPCECGIRWLFINIFIRSFCHGSVAMNLTNPTSIHENTGSVPGLTQWVEDLALLWAVV